MPALPSLKQIYTDANAAGTASKLTARDLRRLLAVTGWTCSDEEWKKGGLREEAKEVWGKLVADNGEKDASSPSPAKKRKTSTAKVEEDEDEVHEKKGARKKTEGRCKYERAADKNFETFAAAMVDEVVEGLAGGAAAVAAALGPASFDDSDDEEEEEDYAGSLSGSSPASPPKKRKKASASVGESASDENDDSGSATSSGAAKKDKGKTKIGTNGKGKGKVALAQKGGRKGKAPPGGFKSAELIAESDDSSNELPPSKAIDYSDDEVGSSKRKGKKRADSVGSGASKSKAEANKPKKERKPPAPKPGDAAKGTEEEEERIKKLKALLTAASGPRAFSASTGAERTLVAARRIEILEDHLAKLGLAVKNGKLPTMAKAKEIGEQRQLDKEMAELGGNPLHAGLRDGKQITADSDDDIASGPSKKKAVSSSSRKKNVVVERKNFAAFLGDQSSDSD
ncbi:hypothetical protein Rt10032_c10g4150 [Rhodotorula toruloides]|uniref:Uncharacterized protein n=1 Tax=Rhodotorula toruloides TaxID=5286 RepID=A0A511KIE1_RHOTO|nr:hypothetical protein Rt10032_c10g4150 [Rhodotorula toruloides]